MSAQPEATGTQAAPEAQPQAGTPTDKPQAGASSETEVVSLEEARKLRSEAQNLRTRLKALEKAEEDRERESKRQAEMAAEANAEWQQLAEQRKNRVEELERQIQQRELDLHRSAEGAKNRIPADLIPFIPGNTREEITAAAKVFAKHMVPPQAPDTEAGAGGRGRGGLPSVEEMKARLKTTGVYN